jgi:hypothetical protein
VIRESVGVDLTATIAVAEYTTDASFLTAIKTALDAAGASTYTVTRDTTTNKIKLTSDGLGGGGIFQCQWTDVNSTAASILGFSTGANDTGALTYTADTLKIHTSEWLRWDLGTASNPTAFALVGNRNEAIKISETATIKLQGNATDVWASPSFEQTLTYHENAISYFLSTGFGAYRYWRLYIEDASNSYGYVEISNVYLGDSFSPTQGAVQFPLDNEFVDFANTNESEMGNLFTTERQQGQEFSLDWFALTTTEFETLEEFIKAHGRAYPFFICLDPNSVFSSNVNRWVKYVRFNANPRHALVSPNVWSGSWPLREEV